MNKNKVIGLLILWGMWILSGYVILILESPRLNQFFNSGNNFTISLFFLVLAGFFLAIGTIVELFGENISDK